MAGATVEDILKLLEQIAPSGLAAEWDNPGLQVGRRDWPVKTIWIALDPALAVVQAACEAKADLLITHHPLIFRPLSQVDFSRPEGAVILLAAQNRLAVVAAHTNADSANGGLNDLLAEKIGLKPIGPASRDGKEDPLAPAGQGGMARIGQLPAPVPFMEFAGYLKRRLGLSQIKIAGDPGLQVKKVFVCTGSGSSLMPDFLASGTQVYVSGDLRFHDAKTAAAEGVGLIDIGHFGSEHPFVALFKKRLEQLIKDAKIEVRVCAYELEKDPFRII